MKNNDLKARARALPRLGSRVRIPSPAPNFLKEIRVIKTALRGQATAYTDFLLKM